MLCVIITFILLNKPHIFPLRQNLCNRFLPREREFLRINESMYVFIQYNVTKLPKLKSFRLHFLSQSKIVILCYICRCETHVKNTNKKKASFQDTTAPKWLSKSEDSKTTLSFLWMPFRPLWSTILPKYKQHKTFREGGIASLYLKRNGERYSWIFIKVSFMTWLANFMNIFSFFFTTILDMHFI